jgi:pimeloyl-ACP methyl ester carboxylesterase
MKVPRLLFTTLAALALSSPVGAALNGDIGLYSNATGNGPNIIFVHGWTCETSVWHEQIPAFDKSYRVVTLDLPSHGRSGLASKSNKGPFLGNWK